MEFKLQSLKVKEADGGNLLEVSVSTETGTGIKMLLPQDKVPAFETLQMDVSREVKKDLREQLRQLELFDETKKRPDEPQGPTQPRDGE